MKNPWNALINDMITNSREKSAVVGAGTYTYFEFSRNLDRFLAWKQFYLVNLEK